MKIEIFIKLVMKIISLCWQQSEYLYEFDYDSILRNEFWIFAYAKAFDYFAEHKKRDLIAETSAFDVLCSFAQCLPPFLENWHDEDQRLLEYIEAYRE